MNTSPNATPRYQALIELLRSAEVVWNSSRLFFARWDLGPSQFNVLNLLKDQPHGLSQSDLSRELIMHRSNVTGLVDRLEKRLLVERQGSPQDRRVWHVTLTPTGHALLDQILPLYHQAAEEVWGDIPEGRSVQMIRDLATLAANAQRIGQSPAK